MCVCFCWESGDPRDCQTKRSSVGGWERKRWWRWAPRSGKERKPALGMNCQKSRPNDSESLRRSNEPPRLRLEAVSGFLRQSSEEDAKAGITARCSCIDCRPAGVALRRFFYSKEKARGKATSFRRLDLDLFRNSSRNFSSELQAWARRWGQTRTIKPALAAGQQKVQSGVAELLSANDSGRDRRPGFKERVAPSRGLLS